MAPPSCVKNWKVSRILLNTIGKIALACLFALVSLAQQPADARDPFTLESIQSQVHRDYSNVSHLSTSTLVDMFGHKEDVLLLDVREADEYAVSHITGAQRVDPGVWSSTFLKQFGDKVRGMTVVFYCSVGVRSSRLADRVQAALKKEGAKHIFNLDGGVFAWHNEKRPLKNAKGTTEFVHPFDNMWGKLVRRQELVNSVP